MMNPLTPQSIRRRATFQMQDMSGLGHPNPLYKGINTQRKRDSMGTGHQSIPSFNINKSRQYLILHWQAQSFRTHHPPIKVLPELTMPPSEKGEEVGTTKSPVLAQTRPPPLD